MENSYLQILLNPTHEHFWLAAMIAYMAISTVILLGTVALHDYKLLRQGKLK